MYSNMTIKIPNTHDDFDELAKLIGVNKVAIDAGHYSPQLKRFRRKSDLNPNYPVIVNVKASFKLSKCKFRRIPAGKKPNGVLPKGKPIDESRDWIIFESYEELLAAKSTHHFYFQFSLPSETERNTLRIATRYSQALIERHIPSTLFVLLGDVWTHPELRPFCEEFAHDHYLRPYVEMDGVSKIEIIKESKCKNKGDQIILKKWGKVPKNLKKRNKLYDAIGGTIIHHSKKAPLFFTSHALLSDRLDDHHAIALTKSERPSCAVTLAGKFMVLENLGYSFSLSVHDYFDDVQINQKVIEGALLAVHFGNQVLTKFRIDVYDGAEFAESSVIEAADYQLMANEKGVDELIAMALLSDAHIRSEFDGERVNGACCPVNGRRSK